MTRTLNTIFDGNVLRPLEVVELTANHRYVITIEDDTPSSSARDAWDVLESLAGSIVAPSDWSLEHDHYLSGSPKRSETQVED